MKRNQPLDILRGIAILLVIGVHYYYFRLWWQIGQTGVDLFFVLSGFLISGLLFDEFKRRGKIDVKRFWVRRGFKIYPAFYVLIFLTTLSGAELHRLNLHRLWPELFFMQDYFRPIWYHTWSLAVEEHFYFALPIALILLVKFSASRDDPFIWVPWIFVVLSVGCLLLRCVESLHGVGPNALRQETHLRIDSLFAGVLLGYWYHFRQNVFKRLASRLLVFIGFACLLPTAFCNPDGRFMDTAGLTLVYVGYGLILANCIGLPESKNFVARSVAWIGKYSYSIYLWHVPILFVLSRGRISLRLLLGGGTISILFGALVSKLVEIPAIQIRDKLFPAKSRPPVLARP